MARTIFSGIFIPVNFLTAFAYDSATFNGVLWDQLIDPNVPRILEKQDLKYIEKQGINTKNSQLTAFD